MEVDSIGFILEPGHHGHVCQLPLRSQGPLDGVAVGQCSNKTVLDIIGQVVRPPLVQAAKLHLNSHVSQLVGPLINYRELAGKLPFQQSPD